MTKIKKAKLIISHINKAIVDQYGSQRKLNAIEQYDLYASTALLNEYVKCYQKKQIDICHIPENIAYNFINPLARHRYTCGVMNLDTNLIIAIFYLNNKLFEFTNKKDMIQYFLLYPLDCFQISPTNVDLDYVNKKLGNLHDTD